MSVSETFLQERQVIDPYRLGHGGDSGGRRGGYTTGHGAGGPASKRVIVGYGFWIFLLSDIVLFSCFFAAHAVLQTATAGGPSGRELFDPVRVGAETTFLLLSSFTCGLSAVATAARSQLWTQVVFVKGFRPNILRRLICFNLFWHVLDLIWVAIFTMVYLIGAGR